MVHNCQGTFHFILICLPGRLFSFISLNITHHFSLTNISSLFTYTVQDIAKYLTILNTKEYEVIPMNVIHWIYTSVQVAHNYYAFFNRSRPRPPLLAAFFKHTPLSISLSSSVGREGRSQNELDTIQTSQQYFKNKKFVKKY